MLFRIVLTGLTLAALTAQAQTPATTGDSVRISGQLYTYVERMPQFKKDSPDAEALMRYLGQNIRYPARALREQAVGKVYVQFVVTATGEVAQPQVTRGVHPALDAEALRVVAAMPRWEQPGEQAGRRVNVTYTLPVTFNIDFAGMREREAARQAGLASAQALRETGDAVARFPGGPRALVQYLRQAPPAGQPEQVVFVRFGVDAQGAVTDVKPLLLSPDDAALQLAGSGEAAARLVRQMPPWQPARQQGQPVRRELVLPVIFSAQPADTTAQVPLPYAEVPAALGKQVRPTLDAQQELVRTLRYPAEALRQQQQGQGLVFFVVNELAQIEQLQVLQSAGGVLDTAALQAVASLRPSAPPMHAGRPVRVYYALPFSFTIK